jgi:hypothetical protein
MNLCAQYVADWSIDYISLQSKPALRTLRWKGTVLVSRAPFCGVLEYEEWQKPETQALTGQSEVASPGSLNFLWCSFRVKRIAHFLELFLPTI